MFNRYFNQLLKTPIWVKITLILVLVYFAYWVFAHPLANFVFNGIVAITPFFLKMLWALVKFFAILIVLQIVFAKTVTKSLHRKILWLAVICITSFIDQFGIFGEFSWNPLKIKSSFDYFLLQLQFLSFYYVIFLLVLPRIFWSFLTQGFVIVMSLLSSGVGVIPLIGGFLSTLLSSVVTFSVLAFFVLNFVAMGLIALEKLIATKNN